MTNGRNGVFLDSQEKQLEARIPPCLKQKIEVGSSNLPQALNPEKDV